MTSTRQATRRRRPRRAGAAFAGPSRDFTPVPKERRGQTIRRIAAFFRPYRIQVVVVLFAIIVTSLLGLVNPFLLKLLIDDAIPQRELRPAEPVRRA